MQSVNDASFYIQQKLLWSQLPTNIQSKLGNENTEYNKAILSYSLQNQLRFKTNLISKVFKNEKKYYEKLLSYSRDNMLLYPYHLQDIVVTGLGTTSFMYYIDMLCQIMSQERSYDFIPNFTAADCLRLLGIGRNQYIDLMNTLRSCYPASNSSGPTSSVVNVGRRFLGLTTANPRKDLHEKIRTILPQAPLETVVIEPWWIVHVGVVLEADIAAASQAVKDLIDRVIDRGPLVAGSLDREDLCRLYRQGMVCLEVPIEPGTTVSVPTLEGFVMNRTTGDYFETLLYKVFVAIDEQSTVEGLAQMLQIDVGLVAQAVSVFCRLQFAHKRGAAGGTHPSWGGFTSPSLRGTGATVGCDGDFLLEAEEADEDPVPSSMSCSASMFLSPSPSLDTVPEAIATAPRKLAFIFDSSLTAYLMMGNLSVGLKNHAVTMFEVGKLSEEGLDAFLGELDDIQEVGEGEARRYYEHAVNLRRTVRRLRLLAGGGGVDLLRCGSLLGLGAASRTRMLCRHYRCLVSTAPIAYLGPAAVTQDDGNLARGALALCGNPQLPHLGPAVPEVASAWFRLFLYAATASGPASLLLAAGSRLRRFPAALRRHRRLLLTPWQQESGEVVAAVALATVNEALSHGPLLLQGVRGRERHLAFPVAGRDHLPPPLLGLLDRLAGCLGLADSCGYISYLDDDDDCHDDDDDDGVPSNGPTLLNLHFGVPLFDDDLNRQVLDQLATLPLFADSVAAAVAREASFPSRSLAIRLLDFIDRHGGACPDGLSGDIPLPTRNLFFHDGKIEDFCC